MFGMSLMVLIFWLVCSCLSYFHHRSCCISRYQKWTVGDRDSSLILCVLLGPLALLISLILDTHETWEDEQKREREREARRNTPSRW